MEHKELFLMSTLASTAAAAAAATATPASPAPPSTPPRDMRRTITLQDGRTKLEVRCDHVESGVRIWATDKFIPFGDADAAAADGGSAPAPVVKEAVPGVPGAFVLHNFFTPQECADLVKVAEEGCGFEQAKVSTGVGQMVAMTGYRNNERVIWHADPSFIEPVFRRLAPHLPTAEEAGAPDGWRPTGLNERLRIFKYSPGQSFKRHYDGGFRKTNEHRSLMTFIAYLGKPDDDSGHTKFFSGHNDRQIASVAPTPGSALIFWHEDHPWSPLHSGAEVTAGTKFAVRSDILFMHESANASGRQGGQLTRHGATRF